MILDDVTIEVSGGKGGDGALSFRREKFVPRGGPDGGNGGDGGDVYFRAVADLTALNTFKFKKHVEGESGEHGRGKKQHGKRGEDTVITVPVGTTATDTETGDVWEFNDVGEEYCIARGGKGGRGNFEFRSAQNQTPRESEKGTAGDHRILNLSLAFIADIGFIGLPSAGKSSLLNALTEAEARVGAYPFTTLEPNLGAMGHVIIADIPGLIKGAHTGKGLGIKFLKHIQKTKLLVHCIDCSEDNLVENYQTIREELGEFNEALLKKKEIIALTKTDILSDEEVRLRKKRLEKENPRVFPVSVIDDRKLEAFQNVLLQSSGKQPPESDDH